ANCLWSHEFRGPRGKGGRRKSLSRWLHAFSPRPVPLGAFTSSGTWIAMTTARSNLSDGTASGRAAAGAAGVGNGNGAETGPRRAVLSRVRTDTGQGRADHWW